MGLTANYLILVTAFFYKSMFIDLPSISYGIFNISCRLLNLEGCCLYMEVNIGLGTISFNTKKYALSEREKGRSLLYFPDDYTVIDIETTGLDPNYDEIIEIGAARVRNNIVVETFSALIGGQGEDFSISSFIENLTGITDSMLSEEGIPLGDAITSFFDFIGDDILMGHNVNFDVNFLYDAGVKILDKKLANDFVDTLRLSRQIITELKKHKLSTLAKHFDIDYTGHRASEDCLSTSKLYNCLREKAISEGTSNRFSKKISKLTVNANDLKAENTTFDEDNPLFEQNVVFTGKMDSLVRKDAMQIVLESGGAPQNNVNKKTNILVLGDTAYASTVKNGATLKQQRAQQLAEDGQDIIVITESVFIDMLS